jgi:hypothetical protein
MKRHTKELLLAYALWAPGLLVYVVSLQLPWFTLGPEQRGALVRHAGSRPGSGQAVVVTGVDCYTFLLERLDGGCFAWLAHPALYVGWGLLACRHWRAASVSGCLALVLALQVPFVIQPREGPWFPAGIGYHLWYASMALLACSAFARRGFFGSALADSEAVRRLASQQRTLAADVAELKQQVAGLVDHQVATMLEEIEARSASEGSEL